MNNSSHSTANSPANSKRTALVTGANRGLGRETALQLARLGYRVVLGMRAPEQATEWLEGWKREGLDVTAVALDVASDASVHAAVTATGPIDVLVNNAGVFQDRDSTTGGYGNAFNTSMDRIRTTFETNTLGALRLCQAVVPGMLARGYGRVVQVSSGMGQLSEMNGGAPAYRISKTALNAITRIVSEECRVATEAKEPAKGGDFCVNSVCPGWVRTDMGGAEAERDIPQGVETIVWAATLPSGGITGAFLRDKAVIAW